MPFSLRTVVGVGVQKQKGDTTYGAEIPSTAEPASNVPNARQPSSPYAVTLNLTLSSVGFPLSLWKKTQ